MQIFIFMLSFALISTVLANISARTLKNFYGKEVSFVKNTKILFLLIVPTKKQVSIRAFVNYLIQLLLFLICIIIFVFGLFNNIIFSISIWLACAYIFIAITSFAISGALNRWSFIEPTKN